jgi:hypothetical protein
MNTTSVLLSFLVYGQPNGTLYTGINFTAICVNIKWNSQKKCTFLINNKTQIKEKLFLNIRKNNRHAFLKHDKNR